MFDKLKREFISKPKDEKVEVFEKSVVFRISRILFLAFGAVSFIGLCLGVVVILYSVTPTIKGFKPNEPVRGEDPSVDSDLILGIVNKPEPKPEVPDSSVAKKATPKKEAATPSVPSTVPTPETLLLVQIKAFFPTAGYPWDDQTSKRCAERGWRRECFRWETVSKSRGAESIILAALKGSPNSERVPYLQSHLEAMPLLETEDGRFVYVGVADSLRSGFSGKVRGALGILNHALGKPFPPPEEGETNPALVALSDEQEMGLLYSLMKMDKEYASELTLVSFMPSLTRLLSIIEGDAAQPASSAVWEVYKGAPEDRRTHHLEVIFELLESVAPEKRGEAVEYYRRMYGEQLAVTLRTYERDQQGYRGEMAELESNYQNKKDDKKKLQMMALYALLSTIGSIATLGLLLGLLAIERNTRVNQTLLALLAKEDASVEGD